jgi:phage recombination protein Bet
MNDRVLPRKSFSPEERALIRRTVAEGATDDELDVFLHMVARTGLDPLARQIHMVKRGNRMSIQTGIDGYRLIADRTGKYAGSDDYRFDEGVDVYHHVRKNAGHPVTATVTVYKIVEGHRCSFTASVRWEEYYPGRSHGFMWDHMPYLMLGKTAEALALRKAFPNELAGIYTDEEMEQASADADHDKARADERPPESKRGKEDGAAQKQEPQKSAAPSNGKTRGKGQRREDEGSKSDRTRSETDPDRISKSAQVTLFRTAGRCGWTDAEVRHLLRTRYGAERSFLVLKMDFSSIMNDLRDVGVRDEVRARLSDESNAKGSGADIGRHSTDDRKMQR